MPKKTRNLAALALGAGAVAAVSATDNAMCEGMPQGNINPVLGAAGLNAPQPSQDGAPRQKRSRKKLRRRRRKAPKRSGALPYPGKLENIENDIKDATEPQTFIGARFGLNKAFFPQTPNPKNQKKQVILMYNASAGSPQLQSGYSNDLQAQVFFDGQKHILIGSLTQEGNASGRYMYNGSTFSGKAMFQYMASRKMTMTSVDLDIKLSDAALNLGYGSQGFSAGYLQSITPTIALGVQGMGDVKGPSMLAFNARYKNMISRTKGDIVTFMTAPGQHGMFTVGYARKVNEGVTLATNLTVIPGQQAGLQAGISARKNTYQYTGVVASDGRVACTLDTVVGEMCRFTLSSEMVHGTKNAGFGFGVSFG